jgi:hypothetical protein
MTSRSWAGRGLTTSSRALIGAGTMRRHGFEESPLHPLIGGTSLSSSQKYTLGQFGWNQTPAREIYTPGGAVHAGFTDYSSR